MPLQMLSTLSQNFNGGRSRRSAANLAKLQANAAATGSGWFTWGWCLLGGGCLGGLVATGKRAACQRPLVPAFW